MIVFGIEEFKDTKEFSPAATHFLQHGCYTFDPPGSLAYERYWDEQEERCLNGYTVKGVRITGPHYFYLNFCQIRRTSEEDAKKIQDKGMTRSAKKVVSFPDFWDGDYDYFHQLEESRKEGKHQIVLKTRRRGYSYKNASLALWKYLFFRESITLVAAYEKKYLTSPRGTITMINSYLSYIDKFTAWHYRRDEIDQVMHKKASYAYTTADGRQVKGGRNSQIVGLTFKDNPDAARGQDFDLVLMEEAGKWPGLKEAYAATRPCVEDGDFVIGQIVVFGTGGDMEAGTIDFAELFYDADNYGFKAYNNIWDEGGDGTSCGYFVPDYVNKVGFIDENGNSLVHLAKAREEEKRQQLKKAADPTAISRYVTEYPFNPAEATATTSTNIFPIHDLIMREKQLISNKVLSNYGTAGVLYRKDDVLKFKPSDEVTPINAFPANSKEDLRGAVVIYHAPHKVNGKIPDNLYYIGHDPYAQDGLGNSLGAAYVMVNPNKFTNPDDIIVASYIGRPGSQDDYNKILFDLAEYYNAKIGFENDRGEIVPFAKRTKKLNWLKEEFEMPLNRELQSKRNRVYGMHMTPARKAQGEIYIRDWLNEKRFQKEDGTFVTNVNLIYDLGLIRELIKYNPKGNFDRVMGLMIAMYHKIELFHVAVEDPKDENIMAYFDEHYY